MKMASLKLTKKERKYDIGPASIDDMRPEYPYGTSIELEKPQLERLDMDGSNLPEAGEEVEITAKGFIKRVEITDRAEDKEGRCSVCIQITDIAFKPAKPDKAEKKASKLDEIGA